MPLNQTIKPRARMPIYARLSDTDYRTKEELKRIVTAGTGEDTLREHVKKDDVKVCEHLIRLVRRDPSIARRVAVCLLGNFGADRAFGFTDRVGLSISETATECKENVLQARFAAGLCDSSEKAELANAITAHIATLNRLLDCVAADLHGRIPSAAL